MRNNRGTKGILTKQKFKCGWKFLDFMLRVIDYEFSFYTFKFIFMFILYKMTVVMQ